MVYHGVLVMMHPCACVLTYLYCKLSALCTGLSELSRHTWPKRACRLLAMTDVMSGKPVREDSAELVTRSVQDMPNMRRWQSRAWTWISLFTNVHVSDPYRSTASMQQYA